ncbi:MAG: hypothetical protein D4R63_06375 [Methylococcaceae bacterium]|nr:MAG: hypothetical protein D4R63_06375 [Methylococcaceae bacterium]
MTFSAKDFIETDEGLLFALIPAAPEQNKLLCFLRYVKEPTFGWKKYPTQQANRFLQSHYPEYLYYSAQLDAQVHAVPSAKVIKHYQPKPSLQRLVQRAPCDQVEADVHTLCALLQATGIELSLLGITGSILVGVHNAASDIDLVCYGRTIFQQVRVQVAQLITEERLSALSAQDWLDAYTRRSTSLCLSDYIWHEQRKINKAVVNNRKFDLNLLVEKPRDLGLGYKKIRTVCLQAQVINDDYAFDNPAEWLIASAEISVVICFTATYTGQARAGEWIEVAGVVEENAHGNQRIVVGSTREAEGEYIKVLRHEPAILP